MLSQDSFAAPGKPKGTKHTVAASPKAIDPDMVEFGKHLLLKMSEPPKKPGTSKVKAPSSTKAQPPAKNPKMLMRGIVVQNEVNDQLETLGLTCAIKMGKPNTVVVYKVKYGSEPFYKAVSEGDVITQIKQVNQDVAIDINRKGQQFQVILKLKQDVRLPPNPLVALMKAAEAQALLGSNIDTVTTQPISKPKPPALTDSRVSVILDLPSVVYAERGTGLMSRADWWRSQIQELSRHLSQLGQPLYVGYFDANSKSFKYIETYSGEAINTVFDALQTGPHASFGAEVANEVLNAATVEKPKKRLVVLIHDTHEPIEYSLFKSLSAANASYSSNSKPIVLNIDATGKTHKLGSGVQLFQWRESEEPNGTKAASLTKMVSDELSDDRSLQAPDENLGSIF